jgi:hypothetical protein
MDGGDELDNRYEAFLDLMTTTALAALSTVIALMHGEFFSACCLALLRVLLRLTSSNVLSTSE